MFVPLKVILQRKLWQNPWIKKGLQELQIKELWRQIAPKIVKGKIAALLRPLYFNKDILVVRAANHFAAQEAKLREEEIKKEINAVLGKEVLKRIICKTTA